MMANYVIEQVKSKIKENVRSVDNPCGTLTKDESDYCKHLSFNYEESLDKLREDEEYWTQNLAKAKKKGSNFSQELDVFLRQQELDFRKLLMLDHGQALDISL